MDADFGRQALFSICVHPRSSAANLVFALFKLAALASADVRTPSEADAAS
jgi:hypothetical protein